MQEKTQDKPLCAICHQEEGGNVMEAGGMKIYICTDCLIKTIKALGDSEDG